MCAKRLIKGIQKWSNIIINRQRGRKTEKEPLKLTTRGIIIYCQILLSLKSGLQSLPEESLPSYPRPGDIWAFRKYNNSTPKFISCSCILYVQEVMSNFIRGKATLVPLTKYNYSTQYSFMFMLTVCPKRLLQF